MRWFAVRLSWELVEAAYLGLAALGVMTVLAWVFGPPGGR